MVMWTLEILFYEELESSNFIEKECKAKAYIHGINDQTSIQSICCSYQNWINRFATVQKSGKSTYDE